MKPRVGVGGSALFPNESGQLNVPDAVAPVVGFRRFGIPWPPASKENDFLIQRGCRWEPRTHTVAECSRPRSMVCSGPAPTQDCDCGLYAWYSVEDTLAYYEGCTIMGWVMAAVIGWGRVFFDEDYWRAEKAQVVAFADPRDTHRNKPEIVGQRARAWLLRTATNYDVPILPLKELGVHASIYGAGVREIG